MESFSKSYEKDGKLYKKTYQITGCTSAGRPVYVGFCDALRIAIAYFIEKYPRFKGRAKICTQLAEDVDEKWEIIDSFQSTSELKEYLSKSAQ